MISSADLLSDRPQSSSVQKSTIGDEVLQIQKQIQMINTHEREHVRLTGEVMRLDPTCVYCRRHDSSIDSVQQMRENIKKVPMTQNEMERNVELSGKNAHVIVPRNWAGKRVKIILLS